MQMTRKGERAMAKMMHRQSKKAGLPPGTLVHVGPRRTEKIRIRRIDYDSEQMQEREISSIKECSIGEEPPAVTWIDITGVHDLEWIERIGEMFDLHPLTTEDIVNTGQRPKMEEFDHYIYVVLKMLYFDEEENRVQIEQVSLILGTAYVISFQEREKDVFDSVRERIRKAKGRVRRSGPDYLLYALIDAVVDSYFSILEKVGERIEEIEEELIAEPEPGTLRAIHDLKREMLLLHKSVWPFREVVSGLERGESDLILDSTQLFFRDVYDHTIQVMDTIETFRDMLSGMLDLYLSSISNRMNEVMKVLTIIATIFIPVTFITGVYGMNFEHMPELKWAWGYLYVWVAMVAVGVSMLFYFKRKKWF
jgi:magnesium transporter